MFPEPTQPVTVAAQTRTQEGGAPTPAHSTRRLTAPCQGRGGLLEGTGGWIQCSSISQSHVSLLACLGHPRAWLRAATGRMGRQKFRLRPSWELSKGNKRRTFRCPDSREMPVDFLFHIDFFQRGFDANFLIGRLPGVGAGVHDPVGVVLQTTADPQQLQEDA